MATFASVNWLTHSASTPAKSFLHTDHKRNLISGAVLFGKKEPEFYYSLTDERSQAVVVESPGRISRWLRCLWSFGTTELRKRKNQERQANHGCGGQDDEEKRRRRRRRNPNGMGSSDNNNNNNEPSCRAAVPMSKWMSTQLNGIIKGIGPVSDSYQLT